MTYQSNIAPRFKAHAKNSALWWDRPTVVADYLQGLQDKTLEVVIQPWREEKTLNQLAYLHGVVFKLASEASGYEINEVKDLLKRQFLTYIFTTKKGKQIELVPSLASLKKDVMSRFIDDCIRLCAKQWQCVVPPPEEVKGV